MNETASEATERRTLTNRSAGNWLEWCEGGAYSVLAPIVASAMFSKEPPTSALLATLAVFSVGFLMRPLP